MERHCARALYASINYRLQLAVVILHYRHLFRKRLRRRGLLLAVSNVVTLTERIISRVSDINFLINFFLLKVTIQLEIISDRIFDRNGFSVLM